MNSQIIGVDLDGCISQDHWDAPIPKCIFYGLPKLNSGEKIDFVITARGDSQRKATIEWLEKYISYPVTLLTSPTKGGMLVKAAAEWKLQMIKEHKIDKFYDNSPTIIKYLKENGINVVRFVKGIEMEIK